MDYYSTIKLPFQIEPCFPADTFATVTKLMKPLQGRITKRKPRASKRPPTTTTYITADPANFRRMVQEVTGVQNGSALPPSGSDLNSKLKQPATGMMQCLPTLDTSAFLLNQLGSTTVPEPAGSMFHSEVFPTLESWSMM